MSREYTIFLWSLCIGTAAYQGFSGQWVKAMMLFALAQLLMASIAHADTLVRCKPDTMILVKPDVRCVVTAEQCPVVTCPTCDCMPTICPDPPPCPTCSDRFELPPADPDRDNHAQDDCNCPGPTEVELREDPDFWNANWAACKQTLDQIYAAWGVTDRTLTACEKQLKKCKARKCK